MPKSDPKTLFEIKLSIMIILGFLALCLRVAGVLDPIHEWCHYIIGTMSGANSRIIRSNLTTHDFLTPAIVLGGYFGEAGIYCLLLLVLGRSKLWVMAGIPIGILAVVIFSAFGSLDFGMTAAKVIENPGNVKAAWLTVPFIAGFLIRRNYVYLRGEYGLLLCYSESQERADAGSGKKLLGPERVRPWREVLSARMADEYENEQRGSNRRKQK